MKTILVTGARAPVALHWARILHAAGHRVLLADSQRFPMARATRCKSGYRRLPAPRGNLAAYAAALAEIVARQAIDLVLPTCEEIFFLAAVRDRHGVPLPLLAPAFETLAAVHDKYRFTLMARGFGADPPPTALLRAVADLEPYRQTSQAHVFKPVWSRFAERVLIRPTAGQLSRIAPTATDPWVAQAYLPGAELCAWALARDGALQALQAYRPLYRAGKGASLAFAPVDDPRIREFVTGFVAATGWTGQVSFDFRHDGDGRLGVIECNPRATSGLHFFGESDRLADLLFAPGTATASQAGAITLPLAMLVYGLPAALRTGDVRRWYADFRAMGNLAAWPGDRGMLPAQLLALAEIAGLALRRRVGLKAAATADIEWNGEPLDPPCRAGGASTIP